METQAEKEKDVKFEMTSLLISEIQIFLLSMVCPPMAQYSSLIVLVASIILTIAILGSVFFEKGLKSMPKAIQAIVCILLTLAMIGIISFFDSEFIMVILTELLVVVGLLAVWYRVTEYDGFFTIKGPFIPIGLLLTLISFLLWQEQDDWLMLLIAWSASMVSSFWIASFIGNLKERYTLTSEDFIIGSICLYAETALFAVVVLIPACMVFGILELREFIGI